MMPKIWKIFQIKLFQGSMGTENIVVTLYKNISLNELKYRMIHKKKWIGGIFLFCIDNYQNNYFADVHLVN